MRRRTTAVEASTPDPIAVDDEYHPDLVRYFSDWCCGFGSEFGVGPATVEAAVERPGLVVLASIGDVRHGYVNRETPCADTRPRRPGCGSVHASNELELTGVQVLSGRLPDGVEDLVVGRAGTITAADPDGTKAMRAALPQGPGVWFLESPWDPFATKPPPEPGSVAPATSGVAEPTPTPDPRRPEHFRVAHHILETRAVFAQGEDGVVAPLAMEDGRKYLGDEGVPGLADRYAKLSDLVADVRAVGSA